MAKRNERYKTLLPVDKLERMKFMIVGVGAIGRQVALALGTMGAKHMLLVDPDEIEEVNLGTQGWDFESLGQAKVDTTMSEVVRKFPEKEKGLRIGSAQTRYRKGMLMACEADVLICCVDTMDARKFIFEDFEANKGGPETPDRLWVDGRMRGETCRVLTARTQDAASLDRYRDSILPEAEAAEGGCTSRSTFYCASIAAGLMVAQAMKWLRGFPLDEDRLMNILAGEMRDMTKE